MKTIAFCSLPAWYTQVLHASRIIAPCHTCRYPIIWDNMLGSALHQNILVDFIHDFRFCMESDEHTNTHAHIHANHNINWLLPQTWGANFFYFKTVIYLKCDIYWCTYLTEYFPKSAIPTLQVWLCYQIVYQCVLTRGHYQSHLTIKPTQPPGACSSGVYSPQYTPFNFNGPHSCVRASFINLYMEEMIISAENYSQGYFTEICLSQNYFPQLVYFNDCFLHAWWQYCFP